MRRTRFVGIILGVCLSLEAVAQVERSGGALPGHVILNADSTWRCYVAWRLKMLYKRGVRLRSGDRPAREPMMR